MANWHFLFIGAAIFVAGMFLQKKFPQVLASVPVVGTL